MKKETGRSSAVEMVEGLTFDDVLLIPADSAVIPKDVDVTVDLTPDIRLNIPLVSAAMDTVTESDTAIAMAREGGIGIIHRNNTADEQATEVDRVKKSESGMISDPITVDPDQRVVEALEVMKKYRISGLPVTRDGKLVGILTNRDLRFETNFEQPIRSVMTKDDLVTVPVGTTLEQAREILHRNRIEKLLVVDGRNNLKGLITIKDILKITKYPNACKDALGRLRVGAAVSVSGWEERVQMLLKVGVDIICVDTAHGHSRDVLRVVKAIRTTFRGVRMIAGNVATGEATEALIKAGVDAVKVGVGPGVDLHDPRRGGRRRSAVHGDPAVREGGEEERRHHHGGRRDQIFRGHHEGDGGGRLFRHDRLPVRRDRGEPGGDDPVPGPLLQGVPRDGIAGGDEEGEQGPVFPVPRGDGEQARPRGDRGARSQPGPPGGRRLPARGRVEGGDGVRGGAEHRGAAEAGEFPEDHPGRACARATCTT